MLYIPIRITLPLQYTGNVPGVVRSQIYKTVRDTSLFHINARLLQPPSSKTDLPDGLEKGEGCSIPATTVRTECLRPLNVTFASRVSFIQLFTILYADKPSTSFEFH